MTIYLVRHASAGRRTTGVDNTDRPLDAEGQVRAQDIAAFFDSSNIDAVLSSPAIRCQQTAQPTAAAVGCDVEIIEALQEGYALTAALALVQRLAARGSSAVLCTPGDVIPQLLDLLADLGVPVTGSGWAKGSVWTLSVEDSVISDAHYSPP